MENNKISVIIPCFNIKRRGFFRLQFLLYSLSKQSIIPEVIVSDGSFANEYKFIARICNKFSFVRYIHTPIKEFNKPILLNRGITQSKSQWICCTDVDYVFREDFCHELLKHSGKDRFICKQVMMSPQRNVNIEQVDFWDWPHIYKNHYGKKADGACQFSHREWFYYCGGYDERMAGWCAMDNQMTLRAKLAGKEVYWMEDSEIVHLWHAVEKFKKPRSLAQMKKNFQILKATNNYKLSYL